MDKQVLLGNFIIHRRSQNQILASADQNRDQTNHGLTSKTKPERALVLKMCPESLLNWMKLLFFLLQKIKCCVSSYQKAESLLPRSQVFFSDLLPLPCHLSNPESKLFSKNYLIRTLVLPFDFSDYFIILFKSFLH